MTWISDLYNGLDTGAEVGKLVSLFLSALKLSLSFGILQAVSRHQW